MRLLLDTPYVYAIAGALVGLSEAEKAFLGRPPARLLVSAVSLWEIRLKWDALYASGDRKGPVGPESVLLLLQTQDLDFLPLTPDHASTPLRDPTAHKDPFDQLLLVQAQLEGARLLTRDAHLLAHPLAVRAEGSFDQM